MRLNLLFHSFTFQRNQQALARSTNRRPNSFEDGVANVICFYQELVFEFAQFLQPIQCAECSVLVDVLHLPEKLFKSANSPSPAAMEFCQNGGIRAKLIQHCKLLLEAKHDQLCGRLLLTLCQMASTQKWQFGQQVHPPSIPFLCFFHFPSYFLQFSSPMSNMPITTIWPINSQFQSNWSVFLPNLFHFPFILSFVP